MARITLQIIGDRRAGDRYCVTITGCLRRRDLQRLERVCGRALEHRTPPLEVRLERVLELDEAARFFLSQLRTRGADIIGRRVEGARIVPRRRGRR